MSCHIYLITNISSEKEVFTKYTCEIWIPQTSCNLYIENPSRIHAVTCTERWSNTDNYTTLLEDAEEQKMWTTQATPGTIKCAPRRLTPLAKLKRRQHALVCTLIVSPQEGRPGTMRQQLIIPGANVDWLLATVRHVSLVWSVTLYIQYRLLHCWTW